MYPCLCLYPVPPPPLECLPYERSNQLFSETMSADIDFRSIGLVLGTKIYLRRHPRFPCLGVPLALAFLCVRSNSSRSKPKSFYALSGKFLMKPKAAVNGKIGRTTISVRLSRRGGGITLMVCIEGCGGYRSGGGSWRWIRWFGGAGVEAEVVDEKTGV